MFPRDLQGCGHDPWGAGLGTLGGRGDALLALLPRTAWEIWGQNCCTQLSAHFSFISKVTVLLCTGWACLEVPAVSGRVSSARKGDQGSKCKRPVVH